MALAPMFCGKCKRRISPSAPLFTLEIKSQWVGGGELISVGECCKDKPVESKTDKTISDWEVIAFTPGNTYGAACEFVVGFDVETGPKMCMAPSSWRKNYSLPSILPRGCNWICDNHIELALGWIQLKLPMGVRAVRGN